MSFMEGVLKQNKPVWDKCIATLFVQDMKDGTLPIEDFKEYMIQDSIYLKNYARVYGKAIPVVYECGKTSGYNWQS